MGQTLTHGVYLPDEGERNCYAGLAANWQILDNSVGTVAAHTVALAGKAPSVHTHTKADITDFPAYGTTAGTICEGNDSRLSDARTPVAHTHGKSDITDLFNSANTWSAANTFTGNQRPIRVRGSGDDIYNVQPQSAVESQIAFVDKNNIAMSYIAFQHRADATETHRLCLRQQRITDNIYYSVALNNLGNFYPENNNAINLGTSTNKWKSFNGINPGVLSLPDLTSNGYIELSDNISANTEYSYTPPADGWLALYVLTTGFHAENAIGIFNGSSSGNAHRLACSATSGINLARSNYYHGAVLLPVIAGIPYLCWIKIDSSTTLASKVLYFYKAAGNV